MYKHFENQSVFKSSQCSVFIFNDNEFRLDTVISNVNEIERMSTHDIRCLKFG